MSDTQTTLTLPEARRLWFIRMLNALVWMIGALVLASGTLRWPWLWAYVALILIGQSANTLLLLRYNPELLIERVRRDHESLPWDRPLVVWAVVVLPLVCLITCGLDYRLSWTQGEAWRRGIPLLGWIAAALGQALIDWAMLANTWFSTLVRIQPERAQRVVTTGPYRFVRHPGYVGVMLYQLGTPMILGSAWALAPALLACAIIVVRTAKEDATLQAELEGYTEYTKTTPWRLLPGVW